jgi:MYXO-CTERM domain-containing protein
LLWPVDARAQEADRVTGAEVLPPVEANESLLLALAGEGAQIVRGEDGTLRTIYGAHFRGDGAPAVRAIRLIERFAPLFGLAPGVRLTVEREVDAHGLHVVRLMRRLAGLPVLGTVAAVRFGADGSIDLVQVSPGPNAVASGDRRLRSEDEAVQAAAALLGARFEILSSRALLVPIDDTLVPAWSLDVRDGGIETSLERVFLDARTAAVIVRMPLNTHALGTVFPRNRVTDMNMTSDVELTEMTGTGLTGRYVRVTSCNAQAGRGGCAPVANATANAEGDFLFEPVVMSYEDAFAEVNAYHHLNSIAEYFRENHEYTWRCGASSTLEVLVNYSEAPATPYDNAAYSPGGGGGCGFLLFGEGVTGDFSWDADVVYHEYGHAVTDALTDILGFTVDALGLSYEPLAINEGISDYWAGTVQGDGSIAESFNDPSLGGGHASLRVIDNDLTCPSDLVGEGHYDGRLFAAMAWDVREAAGAEAADAILYAATPTYLSDVSLASAATGYRAAAMALIAAGTIDASVLADVDAAIAAHELTDCRRVVPLDDGMLRQGYSGNEMLTGSLGRSIAPVHFSIDVPVDATSLTLRMSRITVAGRYSLHLRAGVPVRVSTGRIVSSFEASIGPGGDLVLSDGSPFPLPRCQRLYVAVQVDDLNTAGQSLFGMQGLLAQSGDPSASCPAMPDAGPPAGTDAGVGDAGVPMGSSGCGCRAGARRGPPMLALAGLLVALGIRRRR